MKAGIFIGPQICDLLCNPDFTSKLNPLEVVPGGLFKNVVVYNSLLNHKADNYVELVQDMMEAYQKMGMSHVFENPFPTHSHLFFFPDK